MKFSVFINAFVVLAGFTSLEALADSRCGSLAGVDLPCWRDYLNGDGDESLPLFPLAKRQNGCSIPGYSPGYWDNWGFTVAGIGYRISFRDACNTHDRCYYSPDNPGASACNARFERDLRAACESGLDTIGGVLLGVAGPLEGCYVKAELVAAATRSVEGSVYNAAQDAERAYLARANEYAASRTPVDGWARFPRGTSLIDIDASRDGRGAFAIQSDGSLWHVDEYDNWLEAGASGALHVTAGAANQALVSQSNGSIWKSFNQKDWTPVPSGAGFDIDVDSCGLTWLVAADRQIWTIDSRGNWTKTSAQGEMVTAGACGSAFVVHPDHSIWKTTDGGRNWKPSQYGTASALDANECNDLLVMGTDNTLWLLDRRGNWSHLGQPSSPKSISLGRCSSSETKAWMVDQLGKVWNKTIAF